MAEQMFLSPYNMYKDLCRLLVLIKLWTNSLKYARSSEKLKKDFLDISVHRETFVLKSVTTDTFVSDKTRQHQVEFMIKHVFFNNVVRGD